MQRLSGWVLSVLLIVSGCAISQDEAIKQCVAMQAADIEGCAGRRIADSRKEGENAAQVAGAVALTVLGVAAVAAAGYAEGRSGRYNAYQPVYVPPVIVTPAPTTCSVFKTGATVGYVGSVNCY